jgi:hypothetical protein
MKLDWRGTVAPGYNDDRERSCAASTGCPTAGRSRA